MKMAKKIILASVVLPFALSAGSALAFGGKDHKGGDGQCFPGLDRGILKQLELTDAQKDQLKELRKANKEDRKADREDRKEKGDSEPRKVAQEQKLEQLNGLLLADKFDPAQATKIAQEMAQKHIKRQVSMLNKQYQMISILTPEQKEKFVELQEERLDNCAEKMHKGKDRK
ncbi:CpxP family protein [Marinomonas sp. GJ51-6]|uniref:CpxP family protein n=1 Tax=Marinomonas sp. GJ51-6 TaxID=2992802 RepID=UPI00293424F5|nr:CpxP family protein [Marinomonas sp. GJ51-6]WOD08016.1 CpxP family protein [Marinomonas sp. GJ51-6]